jgi:murein DD-endopeptidase MepM/ murein hydrolase activator NlpD
LPAGANRFNFFFAFSFLAVCTAVSAQAEYPVIKTLTPSDVLFRQFQEDVVRYNRAQSGGESLPPLSLYAYTPGEGESLFFLAARFTVSLESLATLNGIDRSDSPVAGRAILVPSVPGIFMRESPRNNLERLLYSWRDPQEAQRLTIRGEVFYFFPGARFHPVERTFFLDSLFSFPLDSAVITSRYGSRVSPISGRLHFHNGLDLAAPRGSKVYAARSGKVIVKAENSVLGIHIVLSHGGGYETVYGHLDSTAVELNQNVNSGMLIGRVGSTGMSTGPHLHFEVREKGTARNPESLLPRRILR